jgi:hypothetical protein
MPGEPRRGAPSEIGDLLCEGPFRQQAANGRSKGPTAALAIRPLTCTLGSGGGI